MFGNIDHFKIIFILFIIILVIWFKFVLHKDSFENFIDSKKPDIDIKDLENKINNINQKISNIPIIKGPPGPSGERGPPGLQGNPGGNFAIRGALVNEKYSDKVLDRMSNIGINSRLFLGDNLLASNQEWFLDSKTNQLVNLFDNSQCLINDDQNRVYMDNCNNNPNKQWTYDYKTHTLRLLNDNTKCLTASNPSTYSNLMPSIDKDGKVGSNTNYNNISLINLSNCDPSGAEKKWYPVDIMNNFLQKK